jgi:hypothetical protein
MEKAIDDQGVKILVERTDTSCARCGGDEYRVDGYCSVYCRDMAQVEHENQRMCTLLDRCYQMFARVAAEPGEIPPGDLVRIMSEIEEARG